MAAILAAPLFFVALMAFSLKFDRPAGTTPKLADPTNATIWTIYFATLTVVGGLILVGVLSMLLRSRLAVIIPAVAGLVASILLLIPLGTWAAEHAARYPLGIDNIPPSGKYDIWLRGQWEHGAQTTAQQVGLVTIGLAVAAISISLLFAWRGRRSAVASAPIDGVHAPDATLPGV